MADRSKVLIGHAIEAGERMQRFIAAMTLDDYLDDPKTRAAVERQFEIIGEALSVLRRTAPDIADSIAELHKAVGLRNILIHGYAEADDDLVWDVAKYKLPSLLLEQRAALNRLDAR